MTLLQIAKRNIHHCANYTLGGLENVLLDYDETDEEYKKARAKLNDHNYLVDLIYDCSVTELYSPGKVLFGGQSERIAGQIKFLGGKKLIELVEKELEQQGY